MAKLGSIKRQPTERIQLYGAPGVGKTHLIGELAEAGYEIHYFDFENGKKTLFNFSKEAQNRINYYRVTDTAHIPKAGKFMLTLAKLNGKIRFCDAHGEINCLACKNNGGEFNDFDMAALGSKDVVVFESLTKISLSVMNNIFKDTNRGPDTKPEWDDYGRQGMIIESILAFFEQCNTNVVFTSHPMDVTKDDKYECTAPVAGTGVRSSNSGKFFDHQLLLRQEGARRVLYSQSDKLPKFRIKSRYNIDLSKLPQPSLLPLFEYKMDSDYDEDRKVEAAYSAPATTQEQQSSVSETPSLSTPGQKKFDISALKNLGSKK